MTGLQKTVKVSSLPLCSVRSWGGVGVMIDADLASVDIIEGLSCTIGTKRQTLKDKKRTHKGT